MDGCGSSGSGSFVSKYEVFVPASYAYPVDKVARVFYKCHVFSSILQCWKLLSLIKTLDTGKDFGRGSSS